jgi:prepilin-type N-terminal cleavage/methylation domain-containing protein
VVTARRGHSLPELIVALTLLGVALAGTAGAAFMGSRWTTDGAARQEALSVAQAVADSLTGLPAAPGPGTVVWDGSGWIIQWDVEGVAAPEAAWVRVRVMTRAGDRSLAQLHALWVPPIPGPLP